MHKLVTASLLAAGSWLLSTPAIAGFVVTPPQGPPRALSVPEPSMIALFAGGIAAAIIVNRLRKRK